MKDLKIKICGMKYPENIAGLQQLAPDYMGLIFYEKSPRFVDAPLEKNLSPIKRTGVFVNASRAYILEQTEKYQLEVLQLHGEESPQFLRDLREVFAEKREKIELIKVFSVKDAFDFNLLQPYEGLADFFLFDTKGANKGGNGIVFDWQVLQDYPSPTPFFLSGGIGVEEVPAINELYRILENKGKAHLFHAVDINSRFEIAPGDKDLDKLKIFRDSLLS